MIPGCGKGGDRPQRGFLQTDIGERAQNEDEAQNDEINAHIGYRQNAGEQHCGDEARAQRAPAPQHGREDVRVKFFPGNAGRHRPITGVQ
jgi:hypothetical protein